MRKIGKYILKEPFLLKRPHCTIYEAAEESNPNNFSYFVKEVHLNSPNYNFLKHEEKYFKNNNIIDVITKFIDSYEIDKLIYHIYEKEESQTLEDFLKSPSSASNTNLGNKIEILYWIIKALVSLHEQRNSIHLSLDPSHIFIDLVKNKIKFCGNSYLYYLPSNTFLSKISKNPYSAPEIEIYDSSNHSYSKKTDIYSIGIITYAMFSNIKLNPNYFVNAQEVKEMALNIPEIKGFILACIQLDPESRPTAQKLLNSNIFTYSAATSLSINSNLSTDFSEYLEISKTTFKIRQVNSLYPYEMIEPIGKGVSSIVYKVKHQETKQFFAMKKIEMNSFLAPKMKELLEGEIKILLEMKDIDYIVQIKDYFYFEECLYEVLEYCNGGSVREYINYLKIQSQYLKADEIKLIGWDIAEALFYLHKNKIVHRDIKPENILLILDSNQKIMDAKLADFGFSRKLLEDMKEYSTIVGTPKYMAPEIIDKANFINTQLTSKTDIYSFGANLLFIGFGIESLICDKKFMQNLPKVILNIPSYVKEDSPDLYDLINKCCDIDPKKRINPEEIINHPFFKKIPMDTFPFALKAADLEQYHSGKFTNGYLDKKHFLWIKKIDKKVDPKYMKYISRGIDFLQKIKLVPHILKLEKYGLAQDSEASVIEAFEFCNGFSLNKLLAKRSHLNPVKKFTNEEIKRVAKSLFECLETLHKKKYVHRSLNPSHILIVLNHKNEIKDIKVCGFSTFKYEDNSENSIIVQDDEFPFQDPLIFKDHYIYSNESDIYSVGMIIYYMAFGKPLVTNLEKFKKLENNFSISNLDSIDKGIANIIKFCTKSKKPNEFCKYTISEFLKIL